MLIIIVVIVVCLFWEWKCDFNLGFDDGFDVVFICYCRCFVGSVGSGIYRVYFGYIGIVLLLKMFELYVFVECC